MSAGLLLIDGYNLLYAAGMAQNDYRPGDLLRCRTALLRFLLGKLSAAEIKGTTVVFDVNKNALYFSKAILPYIRNAGHAHIYRHIGLYGYRKEALARYVALKPTPLELGEGLEQLRALEHGMVVRVATVDYRGRTHWSIDAPGDAAIAEAIIEREGELLDAHRGGEA